MIDLSGLTSQVERIKTVVGSAKAAFAGLAAKLEECKNDPAAVQQLADELKAHTDELAAAVAANTEAPPSEPPVEPPTPDMRRR